MNIKKEIAEVMLIGLRAKLEAMIAVHTASIDTAPVYAQIEALESVVRDDLPKVASCYGENLGTTLDQCPFRVESTKICDCPDHPYRDQYCAWLENRSPFPPKAVSFLPECDHQGANAHGVTVCHNPNCPHFDGPCDKRCTYVEKS